MDYVKAQTTIEQGLEIKKNIFTKRWAAKPRTYNFGKQIYNLHNAFTCI